VDVMATLEALRLRLEARQDPDGGWGFQGGQVALEPTCLAVLALLGASSVRADKGLRWIRNHRNRNGSWPAFADDDSSGCWTTSLALLALLWAGQHARETRDAVVWLISDLPREAHWIWRWRFRTVDTRVNFNPAMFGCPIIGGSSHQRNLTRPSLEFIISSWLLVNPETTPVRIRTGGRPRTPSSPWCNPGIFGSMAPMPTDSGRVNGAPGTC
jgi:hypothetical protein